MLFKWRKWLMAYGGWSKENVLKPTMFLRVQSSDRYKWRNNYGRRKRHLSWTWISVSFYVVLENRSLFSKTGICFPKSEFVLLKMESVFENRSLFSEIGVWTSEFAFQKSEFAFKKSEAVCLQNRTLKIGVLLKLRPRLCAFFSHVGSTLRRGFRGYMQR